jgi:hypothetical protein
VGQPGGVFERLLNVIPLQFGIALQHFVPRSPVRDLPHDDRDGNSHAANAGSPTNDFRLEGDAIEHRKYREGRHWVLPVKIAARPTIVAGSCS